MAGRARFRHLKTLAVALALTGCSAAEHTVGVYDAKASNGAAAASGGPSEAGSGGDTAPIDDASTGTFDAAIPDASQACRDQVEPAIQKRLNMYLMIDTNFLVSEGGEWDKVQQGILDYSRREEAAGTGLGLRLIDPPPSIPLPLPGSPACDPGSYSRASEAAVAQEQLPANVDELTAALSSVTASLTTPLDPALQGAIDLAFSFKSARPDEEQVVVLVSDAFLDLSCASSAEQLISSAAMGFTRRGIRSYMIELLNPSPLFLPDELAQMFGGGGTFIPLDPVARAGGTGQARSFNLQDDAPARLADRLLEIQREAEPCEYVLPEGEDWDSAILAVDTGMGPAPLARFSDSTECGDQLGAYLSFVDPSNGNLWATACPASCQTIKALERDPLWIVDCDPEVGP